jgi:hypothetical protein
MKCNWDNPSPEERKELVTNALNCLVDITEKISKAGEGGEMASAMNFVMKSIDLVGVENGKLLGEALGDAWEARSGENELMFMRSMNKLYDFYSRTKQCPMQVLGQCENMGDLCEGK